MLSLHDAECEGQEAGDCESVLHVAGLWLGSSDNSAEFLLDRSTPALADLCKVIDFLVPDCCRLSSGHQVMCHSVYVLTLWCCCGAVDLTLESTCSLPTLIRLLASQNCQGPCFSCLLQHPGSICANPRANSRSVARPVFLFRQ